MTPIERMRKKQAEMHGPPPVKEEVPKKPPVILHAPGLDLDPPEKKPEKAAKEEKKPRRLPPDSIDPERGRLPHGARFHVTYDAVRQEWTGSLSIPDCPLFSGTASGVFYLLRRLDTFYRKWLESQKSLDSDTSGE